MTIAIIRPMGFQIVEAIDKWRRETMPRLEKEAREAADRLGIGTQGTRGIDDERDAFRHAYINALLVREHGTYSRSFIRWMGNQIERETINATCPPAPQSSAMDITNNAHGLAYNPASPESPADYAHRLLKAGVLITRPEDAPPIGWISQAAAARVKVCAKQER